MTDAAVRRPRPVRPGATIGVVAPSGPVPAEQLEAGLKRLHAWGYRTVVGDAVLARRGYLAGTDDRRAEDFNRVWANPAVEAVLCARGGYGAMRILDGIDWERVRRQPKFFCGFSDITVFHLAMAREAGLVTFHGPMVAAFGGAEAYNAAGLRRALQEPGPLGEIPWPDPGEEGAPCPLTIRPGVAEGRLAGGNLTLIASLMGTRWEPDFTGCIVLLEDLDEAPYRVDRMLTQLLLAGKLQRAAGILFGDSPTCLQGPPDRPSLTLFEVLEDLLAPLGIPVLYGFPCGHGPHRATLPLGVRARLDAEGAVLTILESALTA
ncbi:muramoyltetrapeptide carboxypeptidase [Symbiobacterium terraclitae]|uniref:Muramoyltetrapeptide carboxypeptidase n=1 Tax=Symbiobacterium terraclitae TaxID=557451 RepID=A0ABS4JXL0_9FIRM|nr:LD-carboxypeptidase [Symbiobacterium terraclitae]MBP2019204.1 muramoyltetrapeptide carboxypeptidase [Symbiobacterium terraclitae]